MEANQTNNKTQGATNGGLVPAPRSRALSTNLIAEITLNGKTFELAEIRREGALLEVYSDRHFKQMQKISRELTVEKAVIGGLQLSKLKKDVEIGTVKQIEVIEAIGALLDITLRQFNLPRIMDGDQIALLALDIFDRYPFLKFEELVYLCRESITGRYNRGGDGFYGGISAFHVHGWINKYLETDRTLAIENVADREHLKLKEDNGAKVEADNQKIREEYYRLKMVAAGYACNLEDREKHIKEQNLKLDPAKSIILRPEERPEYLERLRDKCNAPELFSTPRLRGWLEFYEKEKLDEAAKITRDALAIRAKTQNKKLNLKTPKK